MQLTIEQLFGQNAETAAIVAAEIHRLKKAKEQICIEIGQKLINARRMMHEELVNFPQTADSHFYEWVKSEFDICQATARRYMTIAPVWQNVPETITANINVGALYQSAISGPEVQSMAIAAASNGDRVTENNVVEFRQRTEPRQQALIAEKVNTASNIDLMALDLEYWQYRAQWMADLLSQMFKSGTVTQDHMDIAAANGLFDDVFVETPEREYALSA
jgi:hypothetical protein